MTAPDAEAQQIENLIARLASHDIRYFASSGFSIPAGGAAVPLLLEDLARASSARLRAALIALLLRHPEYAHVAEAVASHIPDDDPARRLLLLSIVVAAALQREWGFSFDVYLPHQEPIRADHLASALRLPAPDEDYGRASLRAAAQLLRNDDRFPTNYEGDWEHAARRLLSQLAREAAPYGA